jgi:hypothetical protein
MIFLLLSPFLNFLADHLLFSTLLYCPWPLPLGFIVILGGSLQTWESPYDNIVLSILISAPFQIVSSLRAEMLLFSLSHPQFWGWYPALATDYGLTMVVWRKFKPVMWRLWERKGHHQDCWQKNSILTKTFTEWEAGQKKIYGISTRLKLAKKWLWSLGNQFFLNK